MLVKWILICSLKFRFIDFPSLHILTILQSLWISSLKIMCSQSRPHQTNLLLANFLSITMTLTNSDLQMGSPLSKVLLPSPIHQSGTTFMLKVGRFKCHFEFASTLTTACTDAYELAELIKWSQLVWNVRRGRILILELLISEGKVTGTHRLKATKFDFESRYGI